MSENFILQNFAESCEPDKYYRLDVVRGVSFENVYDPLMPFKTLIVNFSQYKEEYQTLDKIKSIPTKDIFKTYQVEREVLALRVDVTNQIFLKPGGLWKNGALIWEPSEFFNVSISQSKSEVVSFGSEKRSGTKMPFIAGGFGLQFLKLPDSMINGKKVEVLIPTTEVIRYYFSGSTYLTEQLFNGAFKEFKGTNIASKLFYSFKVDQELKSVYIWLKRHCYDLDAVLIARALADPVAMSAMSYIYAYLAHVKKKFITRDGVPITEACPRTTLPFSDDTEMEVLGQWLPPKKGEDGFTTFLVRTIEKCDHELPFKKIEIESVDSFESSGTVDKNKKRIPAKRKGHDSGKPPALTESENPSNMIEPEELNFYIQRFQNLQNVEIEKIKKVSENEMTLRYTAEGDLDKSNKGSSLPGNYSKNNNLQPWQNRISNAEPIPILDRITSVSIAVKTILKSKKNLTAQCLPVGFIDRTVPFALYSFERPRSKANNYVWNLVGGRKRRALFLELKNNVGQAIYLLEIEGKGNVGFSIFLFGGYEFGYFDPSSDARLLMLEIANTSGARIANKVLKNFKKVVSLMHVSTDNDSFSSRIERAIDGLFSELK